MIDEEANRINHFSSKHIDYLLSYASQLKDNILNRYDKDDKENLRTILDTSIKECRKRLLVQVIKSSFVRTR